MNNIELISRILDAVIVLGVVLFSMTLHELMHGFVAYRLGDDTAKNEGRLTINPLKHLDPIYSIIVPLTMFIMGGTIFGGAKPVPVNSNNLKGKAWGMALVALAGPLTNILLALLSFILIEVIGLDLGGIGNSILTYSLFVNLGFAVFNLIPIPPLDGSRLLYAIAPDGVRNILSVIESSLGVWLIYGLIFVFGSVFSNIIDGGIQGILQFFYWIIGK